MRIRCLDLETTGLEPTDNVVEIAAWDLLPDQGPVGVLNAGERFVKPSIPIPPAMSAIHHITNEDVIDALPWAEVFPLFVDDKVDAYCAHNAKFERQWLTEAVTHGKPWICTLRCAYRIWPDAPTHSNGGLRYWLKPEGLDRTIANISHRAGGDAYVTAHLLKLMFAHPKVDLKGLILVPSQPAVLPRVQFGKHFGKKWSEVPVDYCQWIMGQKDMDEDVRFTAQTEVRRRRS